MGVICLRDSSDQSCSYLNSAGSRWRARTFRSAAISAAMFAAPSVAIAAGVSPTITLPDAVSYEYVSVVGNDYTSSLIGALSESGFGCNTTCTATTALGADPSASVSVNQVTYEGTSGGYDEAILGYYVEYYVPGGATTASYPVTLNATDILSISSGGSRGQAYLAFGLAGNDYGSISNFAPDVAGLVNETDCQPTTLACASFVGNDVTVGPFPAETSLELKENTPYFLEFWVEIFPHATGLTSTATIDPTFTSSATAGTLIFSPGIGRTVPEPSTWTMMLLGFAGLGYAAYRRGRQVRQAIA
jgi:PEP-CTERM motif